VNPDTALSILHVRTVRGSGGGPDKGILASCQRLRQLGCRAEAFYILDRRSDYQPLLDAARAKCVDVHTAFEDRPVCLDTLRRFHRCLVRGRYRIVHVHEYKSAALGQLLRLCRSYRVVATAHGYNRTSRRELLYYGLDRLLLRQADAVVAPSRQMADELRRRGVPAPRIRIIPNGVDCSGPMVQPIGRNGRLRLLYLGRLSPEKDPLNLIDAAAHLKSRGVAVEVTIAGDGPQRDVLAAETRRRGLDNAVRLPGFVSDVRSLLARTDALVCPSRTECMPNAILEAMAAGVPVVATAVGGVPEMIRHGRDGLLCPPQNAEALADALRQLDRQPDLARSLARSARRRVIEEFSFERHIRDMLDLYRRVLESS